MRLKRRAAAPLAVAVAVAVAVLALGPGGPLAGSIAAQEGTPAMEPPGGPLPPGISATFVGGAPLAALPEDPAFLAVVRLTLEPGAGFPADPGDPTGAFVVVEQGTLTVRSEGPFAIGPASGPDEEVAPRDVAAGEEVAMQPGDAAYVGPFQATAIRNDGAEPAVLLLVNILPAGMVGGGGEAATPAA